MPKKKPIKIEEDLEDDYEKSASKDEWESEGCDFLNESDCEERLEERGSNVKKADRKHFDKEVEEIGEDEELEEEEFESEDY